MEISQQKMIELKTALEPYKHVTIMPHIDPDPDAIATTAGLKTLLRLWGKSVSAFYEGRIERAENKSLLTYLDRPLTPLLSQPLEPIILVDTQPGAGNSPLLAATSVWGTIDHHPLQQQSEFATFYDVRPKIGASATLMTEYLRAANVVPDEKLATALFYGIKSDTLDLERPVSSQDIVAYDYLRPHINKLALSNIEKAQVSATYFHHVFYALRDAKVYDNLLVSYLGDMSYPDLPAEMADWLMRYDKIEWVICLGIYKEQIKISVRTHPPKDGADQLVQAMVAGIGIGGGHATMAGGQVLIDGRKPTKLVRLLREKALRFLEIPESTRPTPLLEAT